ncbi:hypothetical protein UFOVP1300_53 [uncultured Caudovirales phage]|uniref:Uncharacterized protein n=1 Tax=uncultured Caudovirales phage TaxID=2100421 RepID=A0A6J5RR50_9CAUD|nr:hypothetical protein UFOVP1068_65 [uncultured Caudovirales phage]CAB4196041.1 hypothetical protein UFOVP1300_53 [uncultured Caudovirales phage]
MTTFTNIFGGSNISPSEISYAAVSLTANTTYDWALETAPSSDLIAGIMDVTATAGPWSLTLPSALEASTGQAILFNNVGSETFIIRNNAGVQVAAPVSGSVWQLYLTDNTTAGGTWEAFLYGAQVSAANAASLAGTGLIAIGSLLSLAMPVTFFGTSYSAGIDDRAKTYIWNGGAGTLTMSTAGTLGNNWFFQLRNEGTGALVVDPPGSQTINGSSTITFQPGDSAIIFTDGNNFYTLGYGQSPVFAFDYTSINVAGSGNYVLSGSELNRIAYNFTGALTGNRTIIVPQTVQQYWVANNTTGPYTLTVKTSIATGYIVNQGSRAILYSDGTNVVAADTGGVAVPIAVSDGGTGATTAGNALINLGGTATGIALFTAASQSAAQVSIGLDPIQGGTY